MQVSHSPQFCLHGFLEALLQRYGARIQFGRSGHCLVDQHDRA